MLPIRLYCTTLSIQVIDLISDRWTRWKENCHTCIDHITEVWQVQLSVVFTSATQPAHILKQAPYYYLTFGYIKAYKPVHRKTMCRNKTFKLI